MYEAQLPMRQRPIDPAPPPSHSRSRTSSSNVFPTQLQPPGPMQLSQPPAGHQRRSPSVNTFSTISSAGMAPPAAYRTSPTNDIRRSSSSRSGGTISVQSSSYVALLRKQKATVWSDRAQYEDPRLVAQQRAAKMRATKEIVGDGGGGGGGRTSTGLSSAGGKMSAKIRHHGKASLVGYAPENYMGIGGVPLRLSATEVEAEDSDEEDLATRQAHHRRTGSSGRSSTASGGRRVPYRSSGSLVPVTTGGSGSGSGGARRWSPGDTPERTGSLVEEQQLPQVGEHGLAIQIQDDAGSGRAHSTRSAGSGSSHGERADTLPDLGGASSRLPSNSARHASVTRERSVKGVDDLRRRGSVDERTMTLTTGRLYIANPD